MLEYPEQVMGQENNKIFYVYIVRCGDGSYYTGYTIDLKRRLSEHGTARGAKYLRGRTPVELVYHQKYDSLKKAAREEARIKRLNRKQKQLLVDDYKGCDILS